MLVPIDNATAVTDSPGIADDGSAISMDSLYPALIQCFAIIICGYFAGLLKIISTSETKGLNTFVGNFALPSLIFLSLVELDWKTVNWNFLLSILISKSIVFLIVLIISLLVSRQNYGRSGLFAIFCTQSNDFAIGYPIVMALYEKIHPEYASYIYLMAPISLAVLNPIGYILLEVSKVKERQNEIERSRAIMPCSQGELNTNKVCKGKILIVLKTIKSIFLNPNMFMTILGVIGGVAFPNAIPSIISNVLKVLGNSFAAPALFLLGLRMVGQGHKLQGHGVLVPGILIIVKLLVLPLVTRQTVNIINAGANVSETTDLSTFGYLYGTLPAAPGVFVIASQYNSDVDLIATSMVACTFISAPLIFISAKVISSTSLNPNDFLNELERFAFDISIIAIIACFWLLALFGLTKKFKRVPHRITCCLVISQLISSVGILLWATVGNKVKWVMYLQFCLFSIGNYSSRLWSAILAITLLFLECRSLCFVLKIWPLLVLTAWGVPSLFTSLLLLFDLGHITPTDRRNPNFQYGNAQAAVSIFLLVMCFIVIIGCLVLHQRYKKRYEKYLTLSKEVSTSETDIESINSTPTHSSRPSGVIVPANNRNVNFTINTARIRRFSGPDNEDNETDTSTAQNVVVGCGESGGGCCSTKPSPSHTGIVVDIEDLLAKNQNTVRSESGPHGSGLCSSQFNCGGASRDNCQTLIHKYQENGRDGLEPIEYDATIDEHQILRHTILLILLLCSMFVNFALSVWTLVMEGMSGIYVELSFIDGFLNFGQSIMVLAVFITNTGELLNPFVKYWRKIWYGANILNLPPWDELSLETKHVCEQFVTHHLDSCRKSIAKDRRWRIKIYKKVFYGNEFVDWIVEVGLAHDRIDATHYAKRLVDGRALRHINNVYHFHDKNLLYTFCNRL